MRRSLQGRLAQFRPPERYLVVGPRNRPRRLYSDFEDAIAFAKRCSREHPGAACRVAQGWPGMERVIIECVKKKCRQLKNGPLAGRR